MNTPLLQTSKQLNKNRNQYYLHNIYMATDYMAHNKAWPWQEYEQNKNDMQNQLCLVLIHVTVEPSCW